MAAEVVPFAMQDGNEVETPPPGRLLVDRFLPVLIRTLVPCYRDGHRSGLDFLVLDPRVDCRRLWIGMTKRALYDEKVSA